MSGVEEINHLLKNKNLWIIVPVFKDVESFSLLRKRLSDILKNQFIKISFVIIDDTGGIDPEISYLKGQNDLIVLTPPFNLGHQRAIVFGLRNILRNTSEEDVILTMDADGEDRPEDVIRLLNALKSNSEIVLAERIKRSESLIFKSMYFVFKIMFFSLTGTQIKTGNFALGFCNFLKKIIDHPSFDLCYSSSFLALKIPRTLVPCERGKRYCGRSRMNLKNLIMHGIRMLMPFMDVIAIRSLILFSASFFIGVLLTIFIVGVKFLTVLAIPGWTSYLAAILLTFSFVALSNFLILFASYTHTQATAMKFLTNKEE